MNNFLISVDCEIHHNSIKYSKRYIKNTFKLLEFFKKFNLKVTFFFTGDIIKYSPQMIKDISLEGHEIASHGFKHERIFNLSELEFYDDVKKSKDKIENLISKKVFGYRAPFFSLTKFTPWAHEILKKLDFAYSSSIMPADIALIKTKHMSENVIKLPNGLIEIPCPVTNTFFNKKIPYLGGGCILDIYLYGL